jgi:hypothetical protein
MILCDEMATSVQGMAIVLVDIGKFRAKEGQSDVLVLGSQQFKMVHLRRP